MKILHSAIIDVSVTVFIRKKKELSISIIETISPWIVCPRLLWYIDRRSCHHRKMSKCNKIFHSILVTKNNLKIHVCPWMGKIYSSIVHSYLELVIIMITH